MRALALAGLMVLGACVEPCPEDVFCVRGQFLALEGASTAHETVVVSATPYLRTPVATDRNGRFEIQVLPWEDETPWGDPILYLYPRLGDRAGALVIVPAPLLPGGSIEVPPIPVWPLDLRAEEEPGGVQSRWRSLSQEWWVNVSLVWPGQGGLHLASGAGLEELFVPDWRFEGIGEILEVSPVLAGEAPLDASWVAARVPVTTSRPVLPISRGAPCGVSLLGEGVLPLTELALEPCPLTDGDLGTVAALPEECKPCEDFGPPGTLDSDCMYCRLPLLADVTIDLEEVVDVRRVVTRAIWPPPSGVGVGGDHVLASVEGEQWVELFEIRNRGAFLGELDEPVRARYVRLAFGTGAQRIGDVSVFRDE
jgi:hypothetical protein